ncbi:hypothetical protein Tco_0433911, partial [Tanacetum coccineum]
IDFRSFMMEGIDGEFHFQPREEIGNEGGGSLFISVNTKAPITNVEPLNTVDPS